MIAHFPRIKSSAGADDAGKTPALDENGKLDSSFLPSLVITESDTTQSSSGVSDSSKVPILDASGKLDSSFLPVGVTQEYASITASEALSAGDFVNIYNSSGAKCRKADASTAGKEAHGFVIASVAQNATAIVLMSSNVNTHVTSATPGVVYLSASVAGGFTSTAPSASGNVIQKLGVATSATSIMFNPSALLVVA